MSNQLAVLQPANEVLPSPQQWQTMLQMAQTLVQSGFLPKAIDTPQKATAVILKGREIGIPAMQSFAHINVIDGKPTCSAELQLALLARGGVTWEWLENSNTAAEIVFRRDGFAPFAARFDLEDAKRAGLLGKQNWQKYPGDMCAARAISKGARKIGPDLIAGMSYTPEELGAEVDEDGTPLEIEGRKPVESPAKALQAPQNAPTPSEQVDTTTGEIIAPEPPQKASGGAIEESVDPGDEEMAERAALIVEIERLEGVFRLTPAQKDAKRTKYLGAVDFDVASLDALAEYDRVLSSAAGTGAQR